jgi:hypothetical protein
MFIKRIFRYPFLQQALPFDFMGAFVTAPVFRTGAGGVFRFPQDGAQAPPLP